MAADLTIVSETARLAEPEIRHGALSPFLILPFLTHAKAVHEFYYTGDALDAQAMYRLGLANAVVPPEDLADEAMRAATRAGAGAALGPADEEAQPAGRLPMRWASARRSGSTPWRTRW